MTGKPIDPVKNNVISLHEGRHIPEPEDIQDWENLWRIPARDHRGHFEEFKNVRMPPQLYDAVVRAYRSGRFPATDPGAFIRTALKLLVDLCYKLHPDLADANWLQFNAISEVLKEERDEEEFEVLFQQMTGQVGRLLDRGDGQHARRLLYKVLESVRAMPMGYRRNRYLTRMEDLWGEQLKAYNVDWDWERQAPVGLGDLFSQEAESDKG